MSHPANNPLVEVWITRRREQPTVVLRCGWWRRPSYVSTLLLLLLLQQLPLPSSLFRPLALLPVVDEESKRESQPHDDHRIYEPVIFPLAWVVRGVAPGQGVVVDVVVPHAVIVVIGVILQEVGDPFAKGPVFLGF